MTNQLRYFLSTVPFGTIEITPKGESGIAETYAPFDGFIKDYNRQISGKLLLTGADFQYMWTVEISTYRCDPVVLTIQKRCAGVWSDWAIGEIKTSEADWNPEQCQVSCKLTIINSYTCINKKAESDVDIFQLVSTRREMNLVYPDSVLEYTSCLLISAVPVPYFTCAPGNPADSGWVLWKHTFTGGTAGARNNTTYWVREKRTVDCAVELTAPWIAISNTCPGGSRIYVRQAIAYDGKIISEERDVLGNYVNYEKVFKVFGRPEDGPVTIDNGMQLRDVLIAMVNQCGLTLKSEFFQINPDTSTVTNYVTGLISKVLNLLVFQKSDIKRSGNAQNATIATVNFGKLLDGLCLFFNLEYRISGLVMRLEHTSYFSTAPGLDATLPQYKKFVRFKSRYSYDSAKLPKYEYFKAKEYTKNTDFEGLPITYNNSCTATGDQEKKEYTNDLWTTDLLLCLNNPGSDSSEVSDSGLFLAATEWIGSSIYLLSEGGLISQPLPNNTLAWSQLFRDYHRYKRPFRNGIMNGLNTTFDGVLPTVIGEKIAIPLCCGDVYEPTDFIKTALGNGFVQQSSWSPRNGMLELELAYEADDEVISNEPPVANTDSAAGFIDQSITIDVMANDSDAQGIGTINLLEITTGPAHGSASVTGDKKILYTPTGGYSGPDQIAYRIRDSFMQYSNIAQVYITIADPAPIAVNDTITAKKNQANNYAAPGLMANDSPGGGTTIEVVGNTTPTGTQGVAITINPNGSFVYNAPNVVGTDTFDYTIRNDNGEEDTATVTINIIDVPTSNLFVLSKDLYYSAGACYRWLNPADRLNFYTVSPSLIFGAQVFEDDLLTIPAASCYLSDGTTVYQTGSGGVINTINPC